ncbi:MAG: CaiB/BaiF CoA-transferase family protein [Candidatus Kapabacteria bacterium]|nr:CaiB/BaiF CoA-transferase family protein [Candidatus Kapabacteria bacterium]
MKTILSFEQALALPYASQRFKHLGWRVIRLESAVGGGDPNRYIGNDTGVSDLHSYFIAPNLGKEAITINLKYPEGQSLLKKLIKELNVDIFLCNTLPMRYKQLGIDYDSLKESNPDLIWCGISALGPDYPDVAGYDPALQAMTGYMHLTGEPERDPMLCGLPIVDLKAGDEAFTQVILALYEQQYKPGGKEIFISMAQCMTSWLITALPELTFNPNNFDKINRCGNEHRSFIPCNCYPTKDGYVYLAIGSDGQWEKFVKISGFEHCFTEERKRNAGRKADKDKIYDDIRQGTRNYTSEDFLKVCLENNLAVSSVNTVQDLSKLDFVKKIMIQGTLPSNKEATLFPAPMITDYLESVNLKLGPAPRLGEHNERVYTEAGLSVSEIEELRVKGVI